MACAENATGTVTIPRTVTSIGNRAFYGCSSLEGIAVPGSVASIGINAFSNCANLKAIGFGGTLNDWLKVSSSSAANVVFSDGTPMSSITEITEEDFDGVTSIGMYSFRKCTSIRSVVLPEGVTSIGEGAFMYCENLESITIPVSLTSIGYEAFMGCTSLTDIIYMGTQEQFSNVGISADLHGKTLTFIDGTTREL